MRSSLKFLGAFRKLRNRQINRLTKNGLKLLENSNMIIGLSRKTFTVAMKKHFDTSEKLNFAGIL